jgi:hypothetical protein
MKSADGDGEAWRVLRVRPSEAQELPVVKDRRIAELQVGCAGC